MDADVVYLVLLCTLGCIPAGMLLGLLTEGFTSFGFCGRGNKHKWCEKCGRRVERVSGTETLLSCVFGGYDATYKCKKCGHVQSAHCYTYD